MYPISHKFNQEVQAKLANFHGWQMPTFYSSIIDEYQATRENIGLFDVSHMGRWMVTGKDSQAFLNYLITNNLESLKPSRALYSAMLNNESGIIDDLIIYKYSSEKFLLVNNAGNHQIDKSWYEKNFGQFEVQMMDITFNCGQIAVQGPKAKKAIENLLNIQSLKYFSFTETIYNNELLVIAATGYTGEAGYELYGDPACLMKIWRELMVSAAALPCGLGSRDLLRLEAGYCLHGNDITSLETPYEAGLQWTVKLDHDFIGKNHVVRQNKKLIGLLFPIDQKLIPRAKTIITDLQGREIGVITSGNFSPRLNRAIAMGYINSSTSEVLIKIRDKNYQASVSEPCFYRNI